MREEESPRESERRVYNSLAVFKQGQKNRSREKDWAADEECWRIIWKVGTPFLPETFPQL